MTSAGSLFQRDPDFGKCWNTSDDLSRIIMDAGILEQMIKVAAPLIRIWDYKKARDHALDAYRFEGSTEEEREAYKDFLDRYFNRKAVAGTKRKHRPRTPILIYEGDKH